MEHAEVSRLLKVLGRRMRDRRLDLGLTQEELAGRAGISLNFEGRLETGEKAPSFTTLVRLSNALGVGIADLVCEEERPRESEVCDYLLRSMAGFEEEDKLFIWEQVRTLVDFVKRKSLR